jgi:hypothetical protein
MGAEVTLVSAFPIKPYRSEGASQKAEFAACALFPVENNFTIPLLKCTGVADFKACGVLAVAAEYRNSLRKNPNIAQAAVFPGAGNLASVARDAPFGANQDLIPHGFLLSLPDKHSLCRLGCGLLGQAP